MICAGWKRLGQKKVNCINAWDFPAWKKDVNNDYFVAEAIYKVLEGADAVVTHNGKRFDWPFLQTRLVKHGFDPLAKTHHIDTKQLAARNIFSVNNRLGYLGEQFSDEKKMDHEGWDLWVKVWNRDSKAMALMTKYCKQDVQVLEKLYEKLRPFASNIPNHNLFQINGKKMVCPSCGSLRYSSHGWRYTKTMSYRRMRCKDCGTAFRVNLQGEMPRTF